VGGFTGYETVDKALIGYSLRLLDKDEEMIRECLK